MNSDIYEDININPSVVIKKIKFNDNTEIELNNDDIVVFVGAFEEKTTLFHFFI